MNPASFKALIQKTLEDHKAQNIVALDVRPLTDIMDVMIVCTATSTRHAKTLADKLIQASKMAHRPPLGVEGENEGAWVLIDLEDVVVHIMLERERDYYHLEKLWAATENLKKQRET